MELKRNEIIKALECCASEEYICTQCPIDEKIKDDCECGKVVARNALALIKELTEENNRLQKALSTDISIVRVSRGSGKTAHLREVGRIRADAIKIVAVREVRDRLTTFFAADDTLNHIEVDAEYVNSQIDKITKEMEKKYEGNTF